MRIKVTRFFRTLIVGLAATAILPLSAFAQPGPPPGVLVDQPPELTQARAKFENMSMDQVTAAGYQIVGDCVSSPFGGMGFHATNFQIYGAQFKSGQMDLADPPILLVDGNMRVAGFEWETSKDAPQPTVLGQKVPLQPGHPGLEEDHYMVHLYFKPDNKMLLGVFDPDLKCPANGAGGPPEGGQVSGMPKTGSTTIGQVAVPLAIVAGLATLLAGLTLRRRKA